MHSHCIDKLLFIDSYGLTAYHFNTLFTLLKSTGFHPTFEPFHHLDANLIDQFETIMVTLSPELLNAYYDYNKGIHSTNPLILQGITLLNTLQKQNNKVIVLLFPSACTPATQLPSFHLLKTLINNRYTQLIEDLGSLLCNLWSSDSKNLLYHTSLITLKNPEHASIEPTKASNAPAPNNIIGVRYCDNKNQYFIGKIRSMTFAEINEDFTYNPIDYALRQKKLLQLQHFLQLIKATLHNTEKVTIIDKLPSQLTAHYEHEKYKKDLWEKTNNTFAHYDLFNKKKVWLGWSELRTYKNQEAIAAENILKSGINLLWLELRPEYYFSPNALYADHKDQFINDFKAFTKALKEQSQKLKIAAPALFIGTDITSNFYQHNLPISQQAFNAYGKIYPKVPSPLDRSFWNTEVIYPLEFMIDNWKTIGSGLALGGIFFDFEMYFNQIGEYTNYMDFSDTSWALYSNHTNNPLLKSLEKTDERVAYLIRNRKFNDYLKTLQTEAYNLGQWIKKTLQQKTPHLMMGAYCVNVPNTWFYLGIVAGLSSRQEPVILATFNNEFYRHYNWLKEHQLYAYHLPALLLSKLQKIEDFKLIPQLSYNNNGLWFNRISHWEESRNENDWPWAFEAEVTPLDTHTVTTSMNQLITAIKP